MYCALKQAKDKEKKDKKEKPKDKEKEKEKEEAPAAEAAPPAAEEEEKPAEAEPKRDEPKKKIGNVFALFNQSQIQEFKEVFLFIYCVFRIYAYVVPVHYTSNPVALCLIRIRILNSFVLLSGYNF